MLIKEYSPDNIFIDPQLLPDINPENCLFLDIETTGFSAINNQIYLIGVSYFTEGTCHIKQWFAESLEDESSIISSFAECLSNYSHLIHFNGNRFDIPFLEQRAKYHNLEINFSDYIGIDLYKRTINLKNILVLPNCKQKTVEQFLGLNRQDKYSGGELINTYLQYTTNPSEILLGELLLHNHDDVIGLIQIMPILYYYTLVDDSLLIKKVQLQESTNFLHEKTLELLITLENELPLPKSISVNKNDCFLSANDKKVTIKVPVYNKELKYFYKNYKEYYYIEQVDGAFHKSVVTAIDSSLKTQAKAQNCYTRKNSLYLKQFGAIFKPLFKESYLDNTLYLELTQEMKLDREFFTSYVKHIIQMMISGN